MFFENFMRSVPCNLTFFTDFSETTNSFLEIRLVFEIKELLVSQKHVFIEKEAV